MIRQQNTILGCLVGMMEEEVMRAAWRWMTQGEPVVAPVIMPVIDLSRDDKDEEDVE